MFSLGRTHEPRWHWDLHRGPGWQGRLRRAADWLSLKGLLGHKRKCRYYKEVAAMLDRENAQGRTQWCRENPHWSLRSRGMSCLFSLSTIDEDELPQEDPYFYQWYEEEVPDTHFFPDYEPEVRFWPASTNTYQTPFLRSRILTNN